MFYNFTALTEALSFWPKGFHMLATLEFKCRAAQQNIGSSDVAKLFEIKNVSNHEGNRAFMVPGVDSGEDLRIKKYFVLCFQIKD